MQSLINSLPEYISPLGHRIPLPVPARLAVEAGQAIMRIYQTDFAVTHKDDRSPLTQADMEAHTLIAAGLAEHFPDIPLVSEEGKSVANSQRPAWGTFWLVDPLDGTKEFISGNGEFTVNIALVENGLPVLGMVYAPVGDVLYVGDEHNGCLRLDRQTHRRLDASQEPPAAPLRVVQSRSHPSEALNALLQQIGPHTAVLRGSSLKFCILAESGADLYPRCGPTREWDTAAGQAVLTAAGGQVYACDTRQPLRYNKSDLLNPYFMAVRSRAVEQQVQHIISW